MNDDTISRKAAIDAVQNAFDKETILNSFVRKVAIDALKALSSVQPQSKREWYQKGYEAGQKSVQPQRWIPVTERLPKESDGKVLITVSGKVETGQYSEFSTTWFIGDMNGVGGDDPIAWMPLPEPWRGGQDD